MRRREAAELLAILLHTQCYTLIGYNHNANREQGSIPPHYHIGREHYLFDEASLANPYLLMSFLVLLQR